MVLWPKLVKKLSQEGRISKLVGSGFWKCPDFQGEEVPVGEGEDLSLCGAAQFLGMGDPGRAFLLKCTLALKRVTNGLPRMQTIFS